jgi:hypothetical protein
MASTLKKWVWEHLGQFSVFVAELAYGRYDSTNFGGQRTINPWPAAPGNDEYLAT